MRPGPARPWAEYRDAVAVLEGEPDPEVALDDAAHGVAGHHPQQQLAPGRLVWRWHVIVGEVSPGGVQLPGQAADHGSTAEPGSTTIFVSSNTSRAPLPSRAARSEEHCGAPRSEEQTSELQSLRH